MTEPQKNLRRLVYAPAVLLWVATGLIFVDEADAQAGRRDTGRGGSVRQSLAEEIPAPRPAAVGPSLTATDTVVADVRVMGNTTIPTSQIMAQLQTRKGRPYDPAAVQRDVRKLVGLPWFIDVQTFEEETEAGKVIAFRVVERPTIRYVEYLGNNKIRDKNLAKETGLKVGDSIDPYMIEEGRRKIEDLYRRNGYNNVQATIVEGSKTTDKGVTYVINEGVSQKIYQTKFEGNTFATDGQLRNKVKSTHGWGYIFKNYVDVDTLDADVQALTAYYRAFGYFQAKVGRIVEFNDDGTWATVRFVIHEGPRYRVRNVSIMGNTLFATDDLMAGLKLTGGQDFEQAKMAGDTAWLKELYGSRGHVFSDIVAEPRFLEQPGELDLVYRIEEGGRFRVGRIFVHIGGDNPHTRIQTALNRLSLRPGDIVDVREIRASERRLMASGLYLNDPGRGISPKISFRIPEQTEAYLAQEPAPTIRGQSPMQTAPVVPGTYEVQRPVTPDTGDGMDVHLYFDEAGELAVEQPVVPAVVPAGPIRYTTHKWPYDSLPSAANQNYAALPVVRGQSPPGATPDPWRQASPTEFNRPNVQPAARVASSAPGQPGFGGTIPGATSPAAAPAGTVQPAQFSEPLPPPGGMPPAGPTYQPNLPITPYAPMTSADSIIAPPPVFRDQLVDIDIDLAETQTGRFLLGVGVNSDAGVTGQIMLDEQNFDWRNPPKSWNDVWNGSAWRGDGQRLRLEAAPGTQVQRYLASWSDPYFMDSNVSLGLSGSYFTRRFRDWDEQRTGGRVSLGYQWTASDVSARLAYRGESVEVFNASNPAQPDVAEALGTNNLHGLRLTLTNDTRDNAFLPTSGHYMEFYAEGVTGDFSYPRGGAEYRRYFLLRERADHTGRHVVSASTNVEITGSNTPIYDRLYAGGFSSMRGFDFRGASPVDQGVRVGGDFMWLSSVEYMFPVTADDMLHGVVFCDFGTVETSVKIDDFRVTPGVGLRVTVPAMGPAPIALDFGFPVAKAEFDDEQVFSFSVGFLR
jgi:outer membrane protein insertion porin family